MGGWEGVYRIIHSSLVVCTVILKLKICGRQTPQMTRSVCFPCSFFSLFFFSPRSLISVPWPPSRALVMRKCAVVFVYRASLSGCSSSHCLNINRSKIISSLGVAVLSGTGEQRAGQPEALRTIYI